MSSLNKAIIIGRVGQEPASRSLSDGKTVVNLSVATTETWKDKSGQRQEKTEWHRVTVWDQSAAAFAANYVNKGDLLYIEGQIESRKFTDNNGQERHVTEVVVKPFKGGLTKLSEAKGKEGQGQTVHNAAKANGYQSDPLPDDAIPF